MKKYFPELGLLSAILTVGMLVVGSNNAHLAELQAFSILPLMTSIVFFFLAYRK
jgi:uncharacterized membrane protein YiaA